MLIPTTMVDMVDMVLDTGPMDFMVVKEKSLKQGSTCPNKCDLSDKSDKKEHFSSS